ncbi:olfactomedin-like protein 2B [Aplochiton taeniatus]
MLREVLNRSVFVYIDDILIFSRSPEEHAEHATRFIRDYSQVAAPLTRLTSLSILFAWTPEAEEAFFRLKRLFTSAPILIQPDPSLQFIPGFKLTLTYRPGSRNIKPDALSRQFTPESFPVLQWAQTSRFACHPDIVRTLTLLRLRFWWPSMDPDTRAFVLACAVCARSKASHQFPSGLLHPLPIPSRPWSYIGVDFVTGLPPSQGNTTILTIVDRFSKSVHFVPLTNLPTSTEKAGLLVLHVIRLHGIPTDIVSNRGPRFVSQMWKAFYRALGASVSLSSGYHPQTNGQTERANQYLGAAVSLPGNPTSWSDHLAWVEYAHNSLSSAATGMSPFECALGYQPPLFPGQEDEIVVPSVRAHLRRCRRIWKDACAALLHSADRNRRITDRYRTPPAPKDRRVINDVDPGIRPDKMDFRDHNDALQEELEDQINNILSKLLGDYGKVKALSDGSDCRCKCVVRPLSRSACWRIEEGSATVQDFYTVETITSGPECKCACIAPPSAMNPCEREFRLKKLRDAGKDNVQLSSIIELLEGSFYGMDLLKLHSVATKLLGRVENIEKGKWKRLSEMTDKAAAYQNPEERYEEKFVWGHELSRTSLERIETTETPQVAPGKHTDQEAPEVLRTGPNGMVIREITFYKSDTDHMVADDENPGNNFFEYDSFSGDGPINLFIKEQLLQHRLPPSKSRVKAETGPSSPNSVGGSIKQTSQSTKHNPIEFDHKTGELSFNVTTSSKSVTDIQTTPSTIGSTPQKGPAILANSTHVQPATIKITDRFVYRATKWPIPIMVKPVSPSPCLVTCDTREEPTKTTIMNTIMTTDVPVTKDPLRQCKDTLATISEPVTHNTYGRNEGAWMKDPLAEDDKIYVTNYYYGNNLLEFRNLEVFKQGRFTNSYKLPYNWIGTGHVVYNGALFYNRAFSRDIIKFDLRQRSVAAWTLLHDAVYEESVSPWQWHSHLDIDFAIDDSGLWIIYSALDDEGFLQEVIVLTRLNPMDLSMQRETTWRTGFRRNHYGNCFIVCGVLYAVDSYNRRDSNLAYAFDTHTNTQMIPRMPFTNNYTYNTHINYNPKEGVLYAWDNGHQVTYNIKFAYADPL